MPTINVNGVPPGSGGGRGGNNQNKPSEFTVSDNGNREADFTAARASTRRAESEKSRAERDYARALDQRTKQLNAEAAASARRMQQEDRLFKSREAAEAKQRRDTESQTKREIRDRERAQAEARAERQRQQQRDLQRGRQEWALRRTAGNMRHRADWDLTPAGFRALSRQSDVFDEWVNAFRRQWNRNPNVSISDIRAGMGTLGGAYSIQNIARLGGQGQHAAERHSWVELARIEKELQRIERINKEQLQFEKSPSERANIQRQENAILHARQRIGAAEQGINPRTLRAGKAFGAVGAAAMAAAPELGMIAAAGAIAYKGIKLAATLPLRIAGAEQQINAMEQPYIRFKLSANEIARAGGFSGDKLSSSILPGTFAQQYFKPGFNRPDWMKSLGLGPLDVVHNLQNFGVAPRSAKQAQDIAAGIRAQFLAPGWGISEQATAQLAGLGSTLGNIGGPGFRSNENINYEQQLNEYFRKYSKVAEAATAMGLDRSRAVQTIASATMQSAQHGALAPMNIDKMGDLWSRLATSGAPGMRSGEGVLAVAQGEQKTLQNLGVGGPTGANLVMSSFFARNGGEPKTEAQLAKQLHLTKKESNLLGSTPAGQRAWIDYLSALKHGSPDALQFLGQYLSSDPDTLRTIFKGSGYYNADRPDLMDREWQAFSNETMGQSIAFNSTGKEPLGSGGGGAAAMPTPTVLAAMQKAAQANGVPFAALASLGAAESRMQGNNPFQVTKGTQKRWGFGSQPMTPALSAQIAGKEYGMDYTAFSGLGLTPDQQREAATAAYNVGLGKGNKARILAAVKSGNLASLPTNIPGKATAASDIQRQNNSLPYYQNLASTVGLMNKNAGAQTAQLQGSEAFTGLANAVDTTTTKVLNFGDALEHVIGQLARPGFGTNHTVGGYMNGGAFVPGHAIPPPPPPHDPVK